MRLGMVLVDSGQDNGSDLEECDDDNEEAVGSQQDSGLLDCAAVSEKADDEDKCTGCDENVSTLLNHGGLCQLLGRQQKTNSIISRRKRNHGGQEVVVVEVENKTIKLIKHLP